MQSLYSKKHCNAYNNENLDIAMPVFSIKPYLIC